MAIVISQHQKLLERIDAGNLISEKALSFTLLKSGLETRDINMSYKAFWIGDCISRAIVDEYGLFQEEEDKKPFYMDKDRLESLEKWLADLALRDPKDHADLVPQVTLTDFYIRTLLGKKITNAEIFSLVEEFVGTVVKRESRKMTQDGNTWYSYFEMDNICQVKGLKSGKYSLRNRHPEHAYKFIFDRAASIDFWNSVRLGLFD